MELGDRVGGGQIARDWSTNFFRSQQSLGRRRKVYGRVVLELGELLVTGQQAFSGTNCVATAVDGFFPF